MTNPTPPAAMGAVELCEQIALKHHAEEGSYAAGKKAGALECAEAIKRLSAAPTAAGEVAQSSGVDALGAAIERALDDAPVSDVLSVITGTFVSLVAELTRRAGRDANEQIKVDGGAQRDITIHAAKVANDAL